MATSSATTVRIGALSVTHGTLQCSGSKLFVPFTITGPAAADWELDEHVVICRGEDDKKLRVLDGTNGVEDDGTAFVIWRLDWPGGRSIRIRYFDTDRTLLAKRLVAVGTPDPRAGVKVLAPFRPVFVGHDWLDPDVDPAPPTSG